MPKAANPPKSAQARGARVAVVGGGISGMTAALRLAQRGFAVTLYERQATLGGNLGSSEVNGVYHDVYPHMFCAWYSNFWEILQDDLGLSRSAQFSPRMGVKMLEKGSANYHSLENATTVEALWANLHSGVLSTADMFLLGFSMLDLAATPFQRDGGDLLDRLDVNGFVYSRGYANEKIAKLQNYILMVIWSIQSDVTAATSYQDFIKHTLLFPHPTPFSWLLKGDLYQKIVAPMERKLTELGCEIRKGVTVSQLELDGDKPKLTVKSTKTDRPASGTEPAHDYVVMAVPGPALADLVMNGAPGARIVDRAPELSEVRRFSGEPIPVVDLYFNKKLPNIPIEQVGLAGSTCDLSILDISQLWTDDANMKDRTALVVAASNSYALTSEDPGQQGYQIIRLLHEFLPVFEPGDHWGDPKSDIAWEMTNFRSNDGNRLFANDVGSWQWRPLASYPALLPNVFFAGDFCRTDVDMATVEAAVQSGLLAAQALQARDKLVTGRQQGATITLAKHEVYSDASLLAAKLAMLPLAYAASAWSAITDRAPAPEGALAVNRSPPAVHALTLPLAFALDWWKTAYWLARKSMPGGDPTDENETAVTPADVLAGLAARASSAASEFFQHLASPPAEGGPPSQPKMSTALAALTMQAWRTTLAARAPGPASSPEPPGARPRRLGRVKP